MVTARIPGFIPTLRRLAHHLFDSILQRQGLHAYCSSSRLSSTSTTADQCFYNTPEVTTVFHIVNTSPSSDSMKRSLQHSRLFLSSDLVDRVLRRVRFSHANPLRALDFFDLASSRKGFYHTPYAVETIVYILGRSRKFDLCWKVMEEARRKDHSSVTTRTLHVLLGRTAKVCSVAKTVETFWRCKRFFSNFDTSCFNALLRALCQEKTMADARIVYHRIKTQFRPDLRTFNTLLSGWKSSMDVEGFFEEMRDLGVKPDLVSYNCLIDVYCKNREMDKAVETVERMKDEEIYPDVLTYTSIIGGLGLVRQPDKARDVLKDMRERGCYPDAAAYNAAIRNFCIARRLGDAYVLMDEMAGRGLSPNATTYNLFLRCFFQSNDLARSWNMYQRMKVVGCLPNTQSTMFLVRLFRRHENVGMALELWNDMVGKGFGSLTLVSDVLFDLLCDMGKLMEAEKCFLEMVDKGQKPSNVSFRRIKVLMELANKHESLRNLSEKMEIFGHSHKLSRIESTERYAESSSQLHLDHLV